MKVAIVHELLIKLGGAERVVKVLADLFPNSKIYTLLYNKDKCASDFPQARVITSSLQKKYNRQFPLSYLRTKMPAAIEEFDFSQYDLVISSSSAFAHGILTPTTTKHLCYCHSPARYLWDWHYEVLREQGTRSLIPPLKKWLIAKHAHKLRLWDYAAASRPDKIIANSKTVQKRIWNYWREKSTVINPPVDTQRFQVNPETLKNSSQKTRTSSLSPRERTVVRASQNAQSSTNLKPDSKTSNQTYFLIISALQPFKRLDLAVKAFRQLPQQKLIIIGDGDERTNLEKITPPNVEFKGRLSDEAVKNHLQNARALLFPGLEDFGITPVEAMAAGKPVVAYGQGGVTESVTPGVSGLFFNELTSASLLAAIQNFLNSAGSFDSTKIRQEAERFSKEVFEKRIMTEVEELVK
jgi:glycosyltransferase involved in cell wall biosynthesis